MLRSFKKSLDIWCNPYRCDEYTWRDAVRVAILRLLGKVPKGY
jgi:hypothetical protein